MTEHYVLYGLPHSLYTGRVRSYLVKNGMPYREVSPGHPDCEARILPLAKRLTIPILETPEGEVIRDGVEIIEHLEARTGRPCEPETPRHKVIGRLFDVIGAEGLLRPAMHYRWNYPDENLPFLTMHFEMALAEGPGRKEKAEKIMDRMRFAGRAFGVQDHNHEQVETLYEAVLSALNEHFTIMPYLFGWKPSLADFGMLAPLYAHLARDPKPLELMQVKAPWAYRWTERMNRPDGDMPDFFSTGTGYLENDEVPETLINVLRVLAQDFLPETKAAAATINQWLAENNPEAGTPVERFLGFTRFELGDTTIDAAAQPYRFYLLEKMQTAYEEQDEAGKAAVDGVLSACGLGELLSVKLDRRMTFRDNQEVWL